MKKIKSLKEQRKIEIIEAAIKVFGEKGYHKGKIEEIAKEAGIGKSTIYEYFTSKMDIFQQVLGHIFQTYIDDGRSFITKEDTVKDKFIALLNYHWDFIDSYADTIEQTFFQFKDVSDEIRPYILNMHDKIFNFILEIIIGGINTGEIRSDIDEEMATFVMLGIISSSNFKRCSSEVDAYNDKEAISIVDMIFRGWEN